MSFANKKCIPLVLIGSENKAVFSIQCIFNLLLIKKHMLRFYYSRDQVVAGELELNHECNLMHWSPEDFESKLQVESSSCSLVFLFPFCYDAPNLSM